MKFGARKRWAMLIMLLTAALSATAWVRDGDQATKSEVVEAPARQARSIGAAPVHKQQAAERVHLEKLRILSSAGQADDAFAARNWRKPTPKPSLAYKNSVVVAPPPSAPPLPFVYMGKLLSDEAKAVFLTQGDRNLIAHEGEVIDTIYRVEKLSDAGLTFVHLPTGIQQNLAFREAQ
jgi:hypothetical protein